MKKSGERKKIIFVFLTAVLVAAGGIKAYNVKKDIREKNNLKSCIECYNDKRYEQAIKYSNLVLDDNIKNAEAYYLKTSSLMALDDYESAEAVVEFACKVTQSDKLTELKQELTEKNMIKVELAENALRDNISVDNPEKNKTIDEVITIDENSINLDTIDVIPEIQMPDPNDIPKKNPSADNEDNKSDEQKEEADDGGNNKEQNKPSEETEAVTNVYEETSDVITEIESVTMVYEETSDVITEIESVTTVYDETSDVITEIESVTTVYEETSDIITETESVTTVYEETSDVITETESVTTVYEEIISTISETESSLSETLITSSENENISEQSSVATDTSESLSTSVSVANIDGIITEDEYEWYKSVIESLIEKLIEAFFNYGK